MSSKIIENLQWRYATKKFDSSKKLSNEDFDELLEVLRLAPSSYGLQPGKFIVVQDPKIREELRKHAWGQSQITDAHMLIVFCAKKDLTEKDIEDFVELTANTRKIASDNLDDYKSMLIGAISSKSNSDLINWNKKQMYLALGMLLATAAQKKIDACPMEGFDNKKFDEVLGLDALGLESAVVCTLGYRASDDKYAELGKVRIAKDKLFLFK
ncbi:MAG: NAD(P)H-dependent oxidoreductase [archaeon]